MMFPHSSFLLPRDQLPTTGVESFLNAMALLREHNPDAMIETYTLKKEEEVEEGFHAVHRTTGEVLKQVCLFNKSKADYEREHESKGPLERLFEEALQFRRQKAASEYAIHCASQGEAVDPNIFDRALRGYPTSQEPPSHIYGIAKDEDQICPICLERRAYYAFQPCGHIFCCLCIYKHSKEWQIANTTCPTCKRLVVSKYAITNADRQEAVMRSEQARQTKRTDESDQAGQTDTADQAQPDPADQAGQAQPSNQADQTGQAQQSDQTDQVDHTQQAHQADQAEQSDEEHQVGETDQTREGQQSAQADGQFSCPRRWGDEQWSFNRCAVL